VIREENRLEHVIDAKRSVAGTELVGCSGSKATRDKDET
jgi:hypothetical protein